VDGIIALKCTLTGFGCFKVGNSVMLLWARSSVSARSRSSVLSDSTSVCPIQLARLWVCIPLPPFGTLLRESRVVFFSSFLWRISPSGFSLFRIDLKLWILQTVGNTLWTVATPILTQGNRINKIAHRSMIGVGAGKDIPCLKQHHYCVRANVLPKRNSARKVPFL
jgi:hypothetical protein